MRTPVRRLVRLGAVVVFVLLAAWGVVGYLFIVSPTVNRPTHVDVIMTLGPELNPRLDLAFRLADELRVSDVAVSIGDTPGQVHAWPCVGHSGEPTVTCFTPDPYTTRGEARELGELARKHGWTSAIVIAPTPQISRARLLINRCFDGELKMVAVPESRSLSDWVRQFVYQSAASVKALVFARGC